MRMTTKGQVTIPQHIREAAGFRPGTELEFVIDDSGVVRVHRQADQPPNAILRTALDKLRRAAHGKMTTEEIMAMTRGD